MKLNILKLDDIQRAKRLTAQQIDNLAGIGKGTYANVKTAGKCRRLTALRLARALEVPLEAFVEGIGKNDS